MTAAYAKAGYDAADGYTRWPRFNTVPYPSATHGGRLVNNYASPVGADAYGRYEDVGEMPVGSVLAKDSFTVDGNVVTATGVIGLQSLGLGDEPGTGAGTIDGERLIVAATTEDR